MNSLVTRYSRWVVAHPWLMILASLLLALAAASGARLLGFSTDYRAFFSDDNPELIAYEALEKVYGTSDNVIFVITPESGDVFAPATLAAVEDLTEASWQLPYATRVDSVTNFQHSRAEGDTLIIEDLVSDTQAGPDQLAEARNNAVREPLVVDRLVSPDADVTGIAVALTLPRESGNEQGEVMAAARTLASKMEVDHPTVDIRITGLAALNTAFDESSRHDMSVLFPIMFVVLLILVAVLLRSAVSIVATLSIIVLSIATAMGLAGWLGILLTPPSAMAPTIIMTLAVADAIHVMTTMFQEMRQGSSKKEALVESMRVNFSPVFLTSVTTAIGFLSLNASDAPPFHDLGNITAMGVLAALFFSVTLLPAMISLLPVSAPTKPLPGTNQLVRLGEFVLGHQRVLLYGGVLLIAGFVAVVPRVDLDDRFIRYFDSDIAFRADSDYTIDNLTGLDALEFSIPADGPGGVNEPAYLQALAGFTDWLRQQPETAHVNTVTDIVKRLNKNMNADDQDFYRIPDQRDLAAQYLFLYEMSVPFGLDLTQQINVDKSATRLIVTLRDVSSAQIREFDQRASEWLRTNAPSYMATSGSGGSLMFANISKRNIETMLFGTGLALVLISALLIFALRSFKLGLISLLPNLAPAGVAFGIWTLLVGQVGLAVSVVTAISLGIVVDDTIHFLSKYLRARREKGASPEDAVRFAFRTVGMALTVTTVVLVAGFLVLAQSSFKVNADMGLLTAITMVTALIIDFLVLPPLLIKLEEKRNEQEAFVPATESE